MKTRIANTYKEKKGREKYVACNINDLDKHCNTNDSVHNSILVI